MVLYITVIFFSITEYILLNQREQKKFIILVFLEHVLYKIIFWYAVSYTCKNTLFCGF